MSIKKHFPFIRFFLGLIIGILIGQWWITKQDTQSPTQAITHTKPMDNTPMVYDVAQWEMLPKSMGENLQDVLAVAGVGAILDTGLDFDGLPAQIYRYHSSTEVPFLAMVSDKYLELNWYYASPKDDDKHKQLSLTYAKKAYQITSKMIGENAKPVFDDILTGKKTQNQSVINGECKNYQCVIVLRR